MTSIHPTTATPRSRAFSLIELLVTISIIAAMVGLSFPLIGAMRDAGRVASATNTVSVAVDAARFLAVTENGFSIGTLPGGQTGTYDGTAIVFTPSGECRLVVNEQQAYSTGGTSLEVGYTGVTRNGYIDVEGRDYIIMPSGSAVAGMRRTGSAADVSGLTFYAPPFAMAFDENGKLVAKSTSGTVDGNVYYNSDGAANFNVGSTRPNNYDPDASDARLTNVGTTGSVSTPDDRLRYLLPFEAIEAVQAIAIYDQQAFREAGLDWSTYQTNATMAGNINAFMTQNNEQAKVFFFSPTTGSIIRN